MLTRRFMLSVTTAAVLGSVTRTFAQSVSPSSPSDTTGVEIKQRFVRVGDRLVHFRRAGSGPPVVLIHASPSDSSTFITPMQEYGKTYTCFAFDTPGFGLSAPLPVEKMNCSDIADAVADTMAALNLPRCPVFGTHTGAAVALELGARHPDRVSGLVLDGVPIFNDDELQDFDGYFAPLNIDDYGGHLTSTWTRFVDQSLWFPWQNPHPRFSFGRAPTRPANTHNSVMRFYRCADNYAPAYKSAVFYGQQAVKSAAALEIPAIMMAVSPDMLFPHMDRLPPLKPGQEIVRLGEDRSTKVPVTLRGFEQYSDGSEPPSDSSMLAGQSGVGKQFIDLSHGQVLVRYSGNPNNKTVVVLHDAPGSSHALESVVERLGQEAHVIALDLPGCGESGPLPGEAPTITEYASVVSDLCDQLGLTSIGLYGFGFGASLAIAVNAQYPELASNLALHGIFLPGAEERADLRANYAPPIDIKDNGSHWYDAWMMLRNSHIMWPWYSRKNEDRRSVEQDYSGRILHDWTFEVMKQRRTYHHFINAAIDYHAYDALAQSTGSLMTCTDPAHRFSVYESRVQSLTPDAERLSVENSDDNYLVRIAEFLTA